jgi:hypothetical protein
MKNNIIYVGVDVDTILLLEPDPGLSDPCFTPSQWVRAQLPIEHHSPLTSVAVAHE